jgi:hypothetical protein
MTLPHEVTSLDHSTVTKAKSAVGNCKFPEPAKTEQVLWLEMNT